MQEIPEPFKSIDLGITPIFNKNKMLFYREENEGYVTIIPPGKLLVERKLLNSTTIKILLKMDGRNTLNDIYRDLTDLYPNVPEETIKKDLLSIVQELWTNCIIDWKRGEHPFMYRYVRQLDSEEYLVRVAFEEDTKKLLQFFKSNNESNRNYLNALLPVDYKLPLLLRYSMFSMNYVYFICERCNQINNIVVVNLDRISSVANIASVYNLNEDFAQYYTKIEELIGELSIKKYTKTRAIITPKDDYFKKELSRAGFDSVAVLEKEIGDITVEFMEHLMK